ncbi:PolC-type DNA polymerase III N-terminal domain-containing protein [Bacillus sp. N9]
MTSRHAEQKERFMLLLQQLQMTEDVIVQQLQNSTIEKLIVDRQNQQWHFYFQFEKIIPSSLYEQFVQRLKQSFQHIATVQYSISITDQSYTEAQILDYWRLCIKEIDGISRCCSHY